MPEALQPHLLGESLVKLRLKMSDYIHCFPSAVKASDLAKLELLGLSAQEDLYAACNADKFEDDMTLWPPLEYAHIFCNVVQRQYTVKPLITDPPKSGQPLYCGRLTASD